MADSQTTEEITTRPSGKRIYSRWFSNIIFYVLLFAISLFLSFVVYDSMRLGEWFPLRYLYWLAAILVIKLAVFGFFHQYQLVWRYSSVSDLLGIIKASHVSTLLIVVCWYGALYFEVIRNSIMVPLTLDQVPVPVMLMDWAATIVVICGARLAIRLYFEETRTISAGRLSRLLIVGAGNAGEVLLREIQRMPVLRYDVVGFVDDDSKKQGVRIHGVPGLGTTAQIKDLAKKHNIDEIVIAMPSASNKDLRRVIEQCQGTNLRFSTVPDLVAIASGKVQVSQIREVDINDLLGREPVNLSLEDISKFIRGKVILITGAGGSIGSELCRQVGNFQPKILLLVEQAENSLFFIDREMCRRFPKVDVRAHICDIADKTRVDYLFNKYRPDVVIHAAAHKHVPLMETNPGEAIKNNVVGTRNVAFAADKYKAGYFVMISTDKAVNPTSIMGSSKRIAEMSIQCLNSRSKTDYITVRFGNVLDSNGSVIPIFRQQIAAGGPVTVTHPEMRRYFMTIPEACQLVLQAATMGRGGEIFVLDMGEPVKIIDLAREMITLSGFRPGEDIEIKIIGMRPGEKLFEELSITGEDMQLTRHPKIAIWKNLPADEALLTSTINHLVEIADTSDHTQLVEIIKQVIPEYVGDMDSMKLHEMHMTQNGNNHHAKSNHLADNQKVKEKTTPS